MPTVPVGGASIYYAARGKVGAPVVFVHGAGSNHLIWNAQLAAFAGTARVYALDLPGHGRSNGAGRNVIRSYADVVCSFLDCLSLDRAVIAGHSMGGAIAQTLGLENPDRVVGLVLAGTGARLRVSPAFLDGILNDFAGTAHQLNETEFALDADARLRESTEQQLLTCGPQVVHGDLCACDAFDILSRVSEIRAPTLVICGAQDRMTPVKYSRYLAAKIPHAQLRLIEGAGHMSMVEKPDEVSRALVEWIPSVSKS
jgi:3-oxoadipate enol-lactonase